MQVNWKRLLSLAVAVVMVLGMVPFNGMEVYADIFDSMSFNTLKSAAAEKVFVTADAVAELGDALKFNPEAAGNYCTACYLQARQAGASIDDAKDAAWVTTWEAYTEYNSSKAYKDKHYYIEKSVNVTTKAYIRMSASSTNVCFELNGCTLTDINVEESTQRSIFDVSGGTLNLMDSKGTGRVIGLASGSNDRGKTITANGATLNVYGGHYGLSHVHPTTKAEFSIGQRVAVVVGGATMNIYGGTLDGKDATGIYSERAGTIFVNSNGDELTTLNMYDGTIVGMDLTYTSNTSSRRGAAVCVGYYTSTVDGTNAVFNMYGGTIRDGQTADKAACGGVSVDPNATFNMFGGTIRGGATTRSGGNLYVCGGVTSGDKTYPGGTANIYGGEIYGGSAAEDGDDFYNNGTLAITGGAFTQDPSKYVNKDLYIVEKFEFNEDGDDAWRVFPKPAFGFGAEFNPAANNGYAYCEACYKQAIAAGETETEAKDASLKKWTALTGAVSSVGTKHYYLTGNITDPTDGSTRFMSLDTDKVCWNLNGYGVTMGSDTENAMVRIYNTTATNTCILNLMDSKGTGFLAGYNEQDGNGGTVIELRKGTGIFNMYGGTLCRAEGAAASRPVIGFDNTDGTYSINIYGGSVAGISAENLTDGSTLGIQLAGKPTIGGLDITAKNALVDIGGLESEASIAVTANPGQVITEARENAADFVGCFTVGSNQEIVVNEAGQLVVACIHDWKDATCTEPKTCKNCNATEGSALDHAWGAGVVNPNADCNNEGVETFTCSRCNTTKTKPVSALGHNRGEVQEEGRVEATCQTPGYYYEVVYCTRCPAELERVKKDLEIDPDAHALATGKAQASTCTVRGWAEYQYCTIDGCNHTTKTLLPLADHKYEAVVTDPTCEAGGYTTHTCSECGDNYTDAETAKLGHKYEVTTEHNKTQHKLVCKNDESHFEWEDHNGNDVCDCGFVAHVCEFTIAGDIVEYPNTDKTGLKTYYCECGKSENKIIPMVPTADMTVRESKQYTGEYEIFTEEGVQKANGTLSLPAALVFEAPAEIEEYYANYNVDFELSISNMTVAEASAKGCYLVGYYGKYGKYVQIPLDGMTIENGKAYPVLTMAGQDAWTYEAICKEVGTFECGIFLSDAFLAENPDAQIKLELVMTGEGKSYAVNSKEISAADMAHDFEVEIKPADVGVAGEKVYTCKVCGYSYTETIPAVPTANVTVKEPGKYEGPYQVFTKDGIKQENGVLSLPAAMSFKAPAKIEEYYANYNVDFALTVSGLEAAEVSANGCYLVGYYEGYKSWVKIPLDGMTIENGKAYPVLAMAGQDAWTYAAICKDVGTFECGIFLSDAFLAENPDAQINLALVMTGEGKSYDVHEEIIPVASMNHDFAVEIKAADVGVAGEKIYTCKDCGYCYTEAIPAVPTANVTVKEAGKYEGEYEIFTKEGVQKANGTLSLPAAMSFEAPAEVEEIYANYNVDFELSISNMTVAEASAKGCYLVGYYGKYGKYVQIPLDGMTIENGKAYPVLAMAGQDAWTYAAICEQVGTFECGIFLSDAFLAENPNAQINLALVMTGEGKSYTVNTTEIPAADMAHDFEVEIKPADVGVAGEKVYTCKDCGYCYTETIPAVPEAKVENVGATKYEGEFEVFPNGKETGVICLPDTVIFAAPAQIEEYYANYNVDIIVELSGFNGDVAGTGCYLVGYYGAHNAWVKIPLDGMTLSNGATYAVLEMIGQDAWTYKSIFETVGTFKCGILLSDKVLAANPDAKVTLKLALTGEGETYIVGQTDVTALGHKYTTEVTAPTCTAEGYTTHTCEICGYSYIDSKVDALGHKYEVTTEYNETQHKLVCKNDASHVEWEDHNGNDECDCGFVAKADVAQIGTAKYKSVAAALADAQAGQTVELIASTEEEYIAVPGGITLDLNGKTLTVDAAASFGKIIDSANIDAIGDGKLIVGQNDLKMVKTNGNYLPVWDGEGYVMLYIDYREDISSTHLIRFYNRNKASRAYLAELLKNDPAGNTIELKVRIQWTNAAGDAMTQDFVLSEATEREHGEKTAAATTNHPFVSAQITNVDGLANYSEYSMFAARVGDSIVEITFNGATAMTSASSKVENIQNTAPVATVNGVNYFSVQEALENADGATVQMIAASTEAMIVVPAGATLDLNGQVLTAGYVAAFGKIVDSTNVDAIGEGKLVVSQYNIATSSDNDNYLPVWDGEGYVMLYIDYREDISSTHLIRFYNRNKASRAYLAELLKNDPAGNTIELKVRIQWTNAAGDAMTQDFVLSEATEREHGEKTAAATTNHPFVSAQITNVDGLASYSEYSMFASRVGNYIVEITY